MKAVVDRSGARNGDLAAIHIAKAKLGWDDSMYRDVLFSVCRVKSSAQLDFTGRKRFLAHLTACVRQMGIDASPSRPRRSQARNPARAEADTGEDVVALDAACRRRPG